MAEESTLAKTSHIAQIVGLVPSFVCMWAVFNPGGQSTTKTGGFAMNLSSLPVLISFVAALTCFVIGGILQLVLFFQRRRALHSIAPTEPRTKSRLKIIEARYGVEGIADPEVTYYLNERLHGNGFAELIAADLFHGFDPASGKKKRLKVTYEFDGRKETIERPEGEWLILPEDAYLRAQTRELVRVQKAYQKCAEDLSETDNRLKESAKRNLEYRTQIETLNRELEDSNEVNRQCILERGAAIHGAEECMAKLTIFSPLQLEALTLAKEITDFFRDFGPIPDQVFEDTEAKRRASIDARAEWRSRIKPAFMLRFQKQLEEIDLKFRTAGVKPELAFTTPPIRGKGPEIEIPWNALSLIAMAYQSEGYWIQGKVG